MHLILQKSQGRKVLHPILQQLLLLLSRVSHVRLCATPWTIGYQAPPSMGFSRQKSWSELPLPSPSPTAGTCQMSPFASSTNSKEEDSKNNPSNGKRKNWNHFSITNKMNLPHSSVQSLSRVRLFATPWIAARQASLSITNSRSSPLQSRWLSRVFSNTTFQKHQFFGAQPSSQSSSRIYTWSLEKP